VRVEKTLLSQGVRSKDFVVRDPLAALIFLTISGGTRPAGAQIRVLDDLKKLVMASSDKRCDFWFDCCPPTTDWLLSGAFYGTLEVCEATGEQREELQNLP
jgi:hypothetical protein